MDGNETLDFDTATAIEACQSEFPENLGPYTVAFGFDGIIDTVREMVDERQGPADYEPITRLETLVKRIDESASTDTSVTIEWVDCGTRTGGLVCHLSRAFTKLACEPTMIGFLGDPVASEFKSEFGDSTKLTLGEPGYTEAVEFNDGKLLLTESNGYHELDWNEVLDRIGRKRLINLLDGVDLLGIGYWAMIPHLPSILEGLATDIWPALSSPPDHLLLDPADIRHFPRERLKTIVDPIRLLNDKVPVTVSGNRGEAIALANIDDELAGDEPLPAVAAEARRCLGVERFVAHGVDAAATATRDSIACVDTLRIDEPELTTSAGDHFNVGVCLGLLEGLNDGAITALGNVVAGTFVRSGSPPTHAEISSYIETYATAVDAGELD